MPGASATSSAQAWSRPGVIGTSSPSLRRTTTCSTVGAPASASSAISFIGCTAPRRREPSAVTSARAPASASREAIAGAAKPEKIGTWTAPRWAQACEAIAASGAIGRKIPTASPAPIPSDASASARRVTSRESSLHVNDSRSPPSDRSTAASSSGRSRAQRWTHASATESLASVNHVVHSMPRESSRTRSQSRANGRARSDRTVRQKRSGSSIETRCSSW